MAPSNGGDTTQHRTGAVDGAAVVLPDRNVSSLSDCHCERCCFGCCDRPAEPEKTDSGIRQRRKRYRKKKEILDGRGSRDTSRTDARGLGRTRTPSVTASQPEQPQDRRRLWDHGLLRVQRGRPLRRHRGAAAQGPERQQASVRAAKPTCFRVVYSLTLISLWPPLAVCREKSVEVDLAKKDGANGSYKSPSAVIAAGDASSKVPAKPQPKKPVENVDLLGLNDKPPTPLAAPVIKAPSPSKPPSPPKPETVAHAPTPAPPVKKPESPPKPTATPVTKPESPPKPVAKEQSLPKPAQPSPPKEAKTSHKTTTTTTMTMTTTMGTTTRTTTRPRSSPRSPSPRRSPPRRSPRRSER